MFLSFFPGVGVLESLGILPLGDIRSASEPTIRFIPLNSLSESEIAYLFI